MASVVEKGSSLSLNELSASRKLQQLAKDPIDLTDSAVLSPERIGRYIADGAGFKLLYGTERVNEEVLRSLMELAQESRVFESFHQMVEGASVNLLDPFTGRGRPALHTATRDLFDTPLSQAATAKNSAQQAKKELDKLTQFLHTIEEKQAITDVVVVAIGGSELGTKAVHIALQGIVTPRRRLHFVNNVDPDVIGALLPTLNLKHTLVVVASKGGTTPETLANEQLLRHAYQQAALDAQNHFVCVTMPGTPLDDEKRFFARFHVWEWVGGRFSTTGMIGLLPLALTYGIEVTLDFLRGAHTMDHTALNQEIAKNPPLLAALLSIWNKNFLGYPTLAIVPYSQALSYFAPHVQQVEMESNGKRVTRSGLPVHYPTGTLVFGEPGTNAQHSFFQMVHQGTTPLPVEFIGFQKSQKGADLRVQGTSSQEKLLANLIAQSIALAAGQPSDNSHKICPGNRPSHILFAEQLTPQAVGALIAFYEHKTIFEGFVLQINSFDQEGVELGKILASRALARIASRRGNGSQTHAPAFPLADAFLDQML